MVVASEPVVNYMLATAMRVDGNSYYSYTDLKDFSVLFPFQVPGQQRAADGRQTIHDDKFRRKAEYSPE
jgi:hypothetical protein